MIMSRDSKIDLLKGLGILLVVLGHSISTLTQPINQVILSFHMPLFFFCAGLTLKPVATTSKIVFLFKKLKSILLPQCIMGLLALVYDGVFLYLLTHKIGNTELSIVAKGWFTQWFLPTLFMCNVVWIGVNLLNIDLYKKKTVFCLLLGSVFAGYVTGNFAENTIVSIEKVPTAFMFVVLGFYTKNYLWDKLNILTVKARATTACLFVVALTALIWFAMVNEPVEMYRNYYGRYGLFLITSILGILISVIAVFLINRNTFIELFGRNSIVVFVTHFSVVKFVSSVVSNVFEEFGIDFLASYVTFGIVVCIELVIIYIFIRISSGKEKL